VLKVHLSLLLDVALMIVDDRTIGNLDTIRQSDGVFVPRSLLATALDTVVGMLKLFNELSLIELLRFAKHDLAHQHQVALLLAIATCSVGETLVEHVCEVDSLAKHVACSWGLRWCNLKTLAEETNEVEHH